MTALDYIGDLLITVTPEVGRFEYVGPSLSYIVYHPITKRARWSENTPEDKVVYIAIDCYSNDSEDTVSQRVTELLNKNEIAHDEAFAVFDETDKYFHWAFTCYVEEL